MFGRKQPPIEQYSDEESEPLIEEVDPDYQPTDKQVREYGLETLGMKLPQDQNLLFLAKQGLKAPIPPNWVPYQSRDGDIYYKHKITQQKIFQHPTDIEYRKKYEQQKQKMARKNLKSMGMKQNLQSKNLGSAVSLGIGSSLGIGMQGLQTPGISNLSNLTNKSEQQIQSAIDSATLEIYENQVKEYEERQQKQWKEFEKELEETHTKKMARLKRQYEEQLDSVKNSTQNKGQKTGNALNEQKNKFENNLREAQEETLKDEMRLIEREEQTKLDQYKTIYEEDNKIKTTKLEQQLQQIYCEKMGKLEEKARKIEEKQQQGAKMRQKILEEYHEKLSQPDNEDVTHLLKQNLQNNLQQIKIDYQMKLKKKTQQLNDHFSEMKKILGIDKTNYLMQIATKKQKLKKISEQKLISYKKKQLQQIQLQSEQKYELEKDEVERKIKREHETRLQQKKKQIQEKNKIQKQKITQSYNEKILKTIEDLYQNSVSERSQFENDMNKKMSQIRMKYINQISNKSKNQKSAVSINLTNRMISEEKQSQVKNKEELIKNLEKQIESERSQLSQMELDKQISGLIDSDEGTVTQFLKNKMNRLGINYKSSEFMKYDKIYEKYQSKYKKDKKTLTQVMKGLQKTSSFTWQSDMGGGSGPILKKYNEDVRKIRQNQEQLYQFEMLLKKSEQSDAKSLENLKNFVQNKFCYKQIELSQQLNTFCPEEMPYNQKQPLHKNDKLKSAKILSYQQNIGKGRTSGNGDIDSVLREHSKFLSSVKNQLNRKLYQVRYQTRI